jgi:hypothetical protein
MLAVVTMKEMVAGPVNEREDKFFSFLSIILAIVVTTPLVKRHLMAAI